MPHRPRDPRPRSPHLLNDAFGPDALQSLLTEYFGPLGLSAAAFEANGDCAAAVLAHGWCHHVLRAAAEVPASPGLTELRLAPAAGPTELDGICLASCWTGAGRAAVEAGRPAEGQCASGLRVVAVPIRAGEETVGTIAVRFDGAPRSPEVLGALARRFGLDVSGLVAAAQEHRGTVTPPDGLVDLRLQTVARLVGEIVDRHRIQMDLRASEQRWTALFEHLLDGLAWCRVIVEDDRPVDWVYLAVNPAFRELTGLSDIVGRRASDAIPGIHESTPELLEIYSRVARTGVAERFENFVAPLDAWYEVAAYCPAPGEFVALFANITARKRAEAARQESEARYRGIFELTADLVCLATLDGHFVELNPSFERVLGYSREELAARPYLDFVHPDDHERTLGVLRDTLSKGETLLGFENRYVRPDGEVVWLEWTGQPQLISGFTFAIARDVTERKRAEAEIKELNRTLDRRVTERTAQLLAANRELEAFSYSVSHDLRSPLRALDGYARMLLEDCGPQLDAEGHRIVGILRGEAQRMGELIDDLLAFSRLGRQSLRETEVDMGELAQSAFGECAAHVPERSLRLTLGPLPRVRGDGAMLRHVFVNLFENAIKYTRGRDTAEIEVGWRPLETAAEFYVQDNGVGFDQKYAHKLFGVFQRLHTESEFEGTGVGLALVQRIIHRHGGRVSAEGELNRGARFLFTLPLPENEP